MFASYSSIPKNLFMRLFAFVFFFVFLQSALFAQGISGTIKDADNNLLNAATVSLLNARDSSILKLNATDKKGAYRFENITSGNYIIMATSVGFGKSYSAPMNYNGNDHTMDALQLRKATTELAGVVVTAKKPLIEVKADKMIVNVEGTINATGNDGLELLRRSPGVMIDKDDNISMAGKTGVAVYIDGRPSPLTGADLANFLRSLQSTTFLEQYG